jgi:hypothetical protein
MTDITPNSDLPENESQLHGHNEHHHPHSSHRHHGHHRHHRHSSINPFTSFGRRDEDRDDRYSRSNQRKTEAFLSKQFLKITGVLFILGAIWLIASVYIPLKKLPRPVSPSGIIEKVTKVAPPADLSAGMLWPVILCLIAVAALLVLSWRRKSVELEIISLCVWVFAGLWWGMKCMVTRNPLLLSGFIVCGSLVYLAFFLGNIILGSYDDTSRSKKMLESVLIVTNSAFYYVSVVLLLFFSGHRRYEALFTAILVIINLMVFYYAGNKKIQYNKTPYLLSTGVMISMFLPWVFGMDLLILFLAAYSIYLMVYSRYSGNQLSIILVMGVMTFLLLVYFYHLIFEFIPSLFSDNVLPDKHLFYKGLIAGFFVTFSLAVNSVLLDRLHIRFSKKWFSRSTYRDILNGLLFFVVYMFCYWAFNYAVSWLIPKEMIRLLIWCLFNSLYFICAILIQANKRSLFLPLLFICAVSLSLFYPALIHTYVTNIRDTFLEADTSFITPFIFHYVVIGFLVLLLLVLLRYVNRSFGGNKLFIKAYWVYFSVFIMFLLFTEFNHVIAILKTIKGTRMTDLIIRDNKILISLLLIACAIIILMMGFIKKTRFLRIYSLIILAFIIAKIIIIDLPTLGPLTKMVVFLFFGSMLLLISFFYSRLRHFFLAKHSHHSSGRSHGSRSVAARPPED